MGLETTFGEEDYAWFEEFTGTYGNKKTPITIETAEFLPVLDHDSFCDMLLANRSFETQLRFLYKYAEYQEKGYRRMSEQQYCKALDSIMQSDAFINDDARDKLEERWMLARHPKYLGLSVSFNEVKNFIKDIDPVMYERCNETVRTP